MGVISTCKNPQGITLPECLTEWINRNMPELQGGVASVKIICCESIHVGLLFVKLRQGGFTPSADMIYVTGCGEEVDFCNDNLFFVQTVIHELIHIQQRRRHKKSFSLRYFWRLIRSGFRAGPDSGHNDEVNAYKRARELAKKYKEEDPCNCWRVGDFPTTDELYGEGVRPA